MFLKTMDANVLQHVCWSCTRPSSVGGDDIASWSEKEVLAGMVALGFSPGGGLCPRCH